MVTQYKFEIHGVKTITTIFECDNLCKKSFRMDHHAPSHIFQDKHRALIIQTKDFVLVV